jgi:hypothetical protein
MERKCRQSKHDGHLRKASKNVGKCGEGDTDEFLAFTGECLIVRQGWFSCHYVSGLSTCMTKIKNSAHDSMYTRGFWVPSRTFTYTYARNLDLTAIGRIAKSRTMRSPSSQLWKSLCTSQLWPFTVFDKGIYNHYSCKLSWQTWACPPTKILGASPGISILSFCYTFSTNREDSLGSQ